MPIQANLFNHDIALTLFIGAKQGVVEYNEIEDHPRENVEAVKACDKEKEVGKLFFTLLIVAHVCTLYNLCLCHDLQGR